MRIISIYVRNRILFRMPVFDESVYELNQLETGIWELTKDGLYVCRFYESVLRMEME